MKPLLAVVAGLLSATFSFAQCLNCGPAPEPELARRVQSLRWEKIDDSQFALMQGKKQVGGFDHSVNIFRPLVNGEWGDVGKPPIDPPAHPLSANRVGGEQNYGVDWSRFLPTNEKYVLNGREVSRRNALSAIEDGLPNDANKLRLTIIGSEEERRRVLADLLNSSFLNGIRDKFIVQDYAPTNWAVAQAGFVTTGHPTIYLQTPTGTVLHRQDQYEGPELLAEAIRKADDKYNGNNDPNLNKSSPFAIPGLNALIPALIGIKIPPIAIAALFGALFFFVTKKG